MDINQNAKRVVDLATQEHNRKAKGIIDEATGDRSPLMDMLDVEPPAGDEEERAVPAPEKGKRRHPRRRTSPPKPMAE